MREQDGRTPSVEQALRLALELALEMVEAESREPVSRHRLPAELRRRIDLSVGREGHGFERVVEDLRRVLEATPRMASRRFFNQLYGGRDPVATLAEILAGVANSPMHIFKVSGPHVLLEQELLDRMVRKVGWADGEGTFTPGGSLSNLVAMVLARNEAVEGAREKGLDGRRLVVYTSVEGHYSIRKNMGLLGFGRANLFEVPADDAGRMDPAALEAAIREHRAEGALPVMINATAGTTVLGAFDPLEPIAEIAARHGVWLHVDGAYGGSVLLSRRHRPLLAGCDLADSFTWDAHKMMGVPLVCSVALTRHRGLLARHFGERASYLFQSHSDELNPGIRSLQCGRRNDALKLWAAWRFHGDEGYGRRLDRMFELTRYAERYVEEDPGLVLTQAPASLNLCFEVWNKSSADLCERLAEESRLLVGWGVVRGRRVIRLVCGNPDLERADVDTFFAEVREVAAALPESAESEQGDLAAFPAAGAGG